MIRKFLETVQIYTTPHCAMGCSHCASHQQSFPNISLATLQDVVENVGKYGAGRLELFANDPLCHPDIREQINLLNQSRLEYAVLTVGATPKNGNMAVLFWDIAKLIDPEKSGFVFSVDYTRETAERDPTNPYCFKALTFWNNAERLRDMGIPVRVNIVISRHNIIEVEEIARKVVEKGFALSFCFVQVRHPDFDYLFQGLTADAEKCFHEHLLSSNLLDKKESDKIISQTKVIVQSKSNCVSFNCFRGLDYSESSVARENLFLLRARLLQLRKKFPSQVLPNEPFIKKLGDRGSGCVELLKNGIYPQMKIGSEGQMIFCCDLHDPLTSSFQIKNLNCENLLESIRTNPYIWICNFFNPCDFSVNYVKYTTRKKS